MNTMKKESPKRKRRWLQFRLRTILILLTVLAAGLSWMMYRLRAQRAAVQAIRDAGGDVDFHYAISDGYNVRRVDLRKTDFSDLTPFARCPNIEKLYLSHTQVKDLAPLAGLKHVRTLKMSKLLINHVCKIGI